VELRKSAFINFSIAREATITTIEGLPRRAGQHKVTGSNVETGGRLLQIARAPRAPLSRRNRKRGANYSVKRGSALCARLRYTGLSSLKKAGIFR
jgi:hypothetical protein